jgi:CheY-like chemotaxis protein
MKTVLVVDDDRDLREALCSALDESGFSAVGCGDGRQALDYLQGGAPRPGLILLDWMMPVMSGGEFRQEQVKDPELAKIPVIVISAHIKADLTGVSDGVKSFLRKPFPLAELISRVESFVPRR